AAPAVGQTTAPATMPPAGTVVTPPAASAAEATTLAPQDRAFLDKAAIGGRTEVQLGKLAEKQAASPAVKIFGRWMATDHALVDARLTMIAHQLGVEMPTRPDQQNQAVIDRLS